MKVIGVDYSSRAFNALAVVQNGAPAKCHLFKTELRQDEADARMLREYETWMTYKLGLLKPDIVIVEELAVFQNPKVIRALSHREAVALLVASKKAPIVVHKTIRQARVVVFKNGSISKDDAWKVRAKFIDFEFSKKTVGGTDEMDAMTLALAAPTLLERK